MIIRALVQDIAFLTKRLGPPDWLFLTGDVAFSGGALSDQSFDEYSVATERIRELMDAAQVKAQRVAVIPGNHDVDRKIAKSSRASSALNDGVRGNSIALDSVLANEEDRPILLRKLAQFNKFAAHFGPQAKQSTPGDVAWSTEEFAGYVIVGLNTALSSGADDHPGSLALGNSQIIVIDRAPRRRFLIVLAHHPPKWIADGQQLCNKLQRRQHLLLTGHEHTSNLFSGVTVGGGQLLHLTSGAAHGEQGETGRHGYAWGELYPNKLVYWPRVWNSNQDGFVAAREDVPNLGANDDISIKLSAQSATQSPSALSTLAKHYCHLVVEQLESRNNFLSGQYVTLRCVASLRPSGDVLDTLEVALRKSGASNRLAFLGDFGCGKTCLAQELALRLGRQFAISKTKSLPLLLRLARAREYESASSFALAEVRTHLGEMGSQAEALVNEGGFVFILDGLDEMPRDASLPEIRRCLLFLEDIHHLGRKVNRSVITSRTTFFKSQVEEGRLRDFKVHYILPWGDAEWQRCLEISGLGQLKKVLDPIYSVTDLVRKPFFVKLIVENHEAIIAFGQRQRKIVSTDLYKLYVDRVLAEAVLKPTSVLDEHEKRHLIQRAALEMFFKGDTKLSVESITNIIVAEQSYDRHNRADVVNDIINNTLFNRIMQDFVTFPHKSVMEYLVAEKLSEECGRGKFENYKRRFFYAELYVFCALLQADQMHVDRLFAELDNSRDEYFVPNALVILRVLRVFFEFANEERLTRVLLRNLSAYEPTALTARYSSAFSFWRCPFSPDLPDRVLQLYRKEPFGLIRRILWLTLEYYRDTFDPTIELPLEGMTDTFAPELARETFALHPSGVEALLAVNLQGDTGTEKGPYWIVQIGTSLFLSSSGEVRLLPAMLRDLSSPIRQLRENAVICLGNLLRHANGQSHVRERVQMFLSEQGPNIPSEIREALKEYVS